MIDIHVNNLGFIVGALQISAQLGNEKVCQNQDQLIEIDVLQCAKY